MIFFPRSGNLEDQQNLAEFELVVNADDNIKLVGWAIPNQDTSLALIYFGGNAEEVSDSLLLHKEMVDISTVAVNYRGYGQSQGKPSAEKLRSDALLVFDNAIKRLELEPNQIIVLGRSLGSNMAAYVAANRDVAGLILVTPFDSVAEVAASRYWMFPVRSMIRHPFDTVADSKTIDIPTLILRAQNDYVIPHKATDRLIKNWQGEKKFTDTTIPNTYHNDIVDANEYKESIQEFINNFKQLN